MARIRYLKPSFFTSDNVSALPPLTRLLFQGLWCLADREGLLADRPARIRAEVMPYDKINMDHALNVLAEHGFICRYEAEGVALIHVSKFHDHQRPHHKEPLSTLHACPKHEPSMNQASTRAGAPVTGTSKGMENGNRDGQQEQELRVEVDDAVPLLRHPSGEKRPDIFALYEGMGWTIAPNIIDVLANMEAEYDAKWIADAFQMGAEARARNLNYMQKILSHWAEHSRDCECMKQSRASGRSNQKSDVEVFPDGVQTGTGVFVKSMLQEAADERKRAANG